MILLTGDRSEESIRRGVKLLGSAVGVDNAMAVLNTTFNKFLF